MSAIGIIFNRDGAPVSHQMLSTLGSGLNRLGPDGGNELISGSVGMTYRAFHTTRESHFEQQPLISPQGNILAMDGVIFNRSELIDLLRDDLRGDRTDAGLVSAGLDKYGEGFLAKVVGNFALTWWQPRTQTLTMARDPFGVRPLFYYYDNSRLIAASDLKSVLDGVGGTLELDEEYVIGYLVMFPEPKRTPYKNFHAVEPGHFITLQNGELQTRRIWGPDPNKSIRYQTDAEYEEHLRQLLYDGVRCCLRTDDRPVWASLSGGLDSSSVVCIADELVKRNDAEAKNLGTFSIVYDKSATADERRFIRMIEEKRGIPGFHVSEDEYWMRFPPPETSFLLSPSPLHCAPGRLNSLYEEMGKTGARVMLSGLGGDQVFWNMLEASPELSDLMAKGEFLHLHRRLRTWSKEFKKPYLKLLWLEALLPLLPTPIRARYQTKPSLSEWFTEKFIQKERVRERLLFQPDVYGFRQSSKRLHSNSILEVVWLIAAGNHEERHGMETRYPLLYRPLIEFILAIPFDQILRPGGTRSLMRRALKDLLPQQILARKTKGVIGEALRRGIAGEWARVEPLFTDSRLCALGYADYDALWSVLKLARHGGKIAVGSLINTISLELWLRSVESHGVIIRRINEPGTVSNLHPSTMRHLTADTQ